MDNSVNNDDFFELPKDNVQNNSEPVVAKEKVNSEPQVSQSVTPQVSPVDSKPQFDVSDLASSDMSISYFDGTVLELLGYFFLDGIITGCTAGIFKPWGDCLLKKYKYSHTVYNGKRLKFDGQPDELFVQRFKWIFFTMITLGIYAFWVPIRKKQWEVANVHFEDESENDQKSYFTGTVLGLIGTNILCALITVISFGLLTPLAYCKRTKWFLNNYVISGNYVEFDGRAFKLFLNQLKWFFLSLITFGIYGWFVPLRFIQWVVSNTSLAGKSSN